MAASMPSCLRDANTTCSPNGVNKKQEAQSGEWSIAKNSEREKPERDTQKISLATTISSANEKRTCNATAVERTTLKLDSRFGFLSAQQAATNNLLKQNEESKVTFASSSATNLVENSMERKNVTEESVIPGSAVSIEECVYISKVELGPLYSMQSSISHSPSTIQPEAEGELIVRMPEMIKLLSSFPKYSNIPGMPCLHQPKIIAWPNDRGILIQKLQSNRIPLLLYSDYSSYLYGSNTDITKMMHLTLSCSRSASISGFPSYVKCKPNMAHLLPTCPRFSRIPGLASVEFVSGWEKRFWDRSPLWKNPVQIKETFILPLSWTQEQAVSDSNMIKVMVAMLPTCSKKASLPGFPSAPQPLASNNPNNAYFLPTCPGQTMIAGMPFREKNMAYNDCWHILSGLIFDRPLRRKSILVQEKSCADKEHIKLIVYMLPSCPWKAAVPCFPSVSFKEYNAPSVSFAPSQDPSMVDLLPTFPRKSRVNGLPSKELVSYQSADLDRNHILIERPLRMHNALIRDTFPITSEDRDKKEMVAMLPSCPVTTCLVGMPTRPQKLLPSIIYLVPMCPKLARTPGMPSQDQNTSHNRDWHALKQLLVIPQKRTQVYIGEWILEDTENLKYMVNMGCLASASRQKPCMINLMPSLPRHSGISGLPSKTGQNVCSSSCTEWFAYKNMLWETAFFRREVQILNEVLFFDKNTTEGMTALLSSCPENVSVPGFPSALTLTNGPTIVKSSHLFPSVPCQMSADIPSMNNLLFTCPDQSRVHGIPSIFHRESYGADWIVSPVWQRPLKNLGRMSVIHDHKMHSSDKTLVRIMVSMLPPCPKHSYITGIPSKVGKRRAKVLLKEAPSMLKSLGTFPKHSKIPGFPAKNSTKGGWYFDSNVVWENCFNRRYKIVQQNFKVLELSFADRKIMLSMQLSCPRQALNPGFPSASQIRASDAIADKYLDMVQLLPCCPRQSNIIGFPSRMPVISTSNVEGRSVVIVDMQCCSTCCKMSDYCYNDKINTILSLETVVPNNSLSPGFIGIPLPDLVHFQNMANIVPSCPKKGSVLGVPSTNVHHSGHRWPGKTLLLAESQAELTEKEKENQMRQRLLPEELSLHKTSYPSQDMPEDVQQSMKIESTCPLQTIVQDLTLSIYETQVDQLSSVRGTEMLYDDASPNIIEPDTIKPQSDPCSPLEVNKKEQANWISIDADEKTVLGKG